MILTGYKRDLNFDDLWNLRPSDRCSTVVPDFEHQWRREIAKQDSHRYVLMMIIVPLQIVQIVWFNFRVMLQKNILYSRNKKPKPVEMKAASIWKAICRTFGGYYLIGGLYKVACDLIGFLNPLILK